MNTLLSINNYYYRRGGAEVVFLEHNKLFEELGWNVVPFAMLHESNLETPWSKYFVDELEFGQKYSLPEKAARLLKSVYSFEARRKLKALIADTKPDVCHAHNIYHHISPSILGVLREWEIPTVLTLHDLKIACPAYKMLEHNRICERCKNGKLYNVLMHKCVKNSYTLSSAVMLESALHRILKSYTNNVNAFVVPSRFYMEKFVEWGFEREMFVHIPNFVDIEKHRPAIAIGKKYLYFGRLSAEKGLSTLIRAASQARVPLVIVGTGPEQNLLEKLAHDLGADVLFLGYRSGSELYDLISSSRATIIPSEWYENAPVSILESYAHGKPVIGARIGGIPELIRENETGLTFKSGSIEELVELFDKVERMPDNVLMTMGSNARAWVETEFTADRYRDRVLGLYGRIGVSC